MFKNQKLFLRFRKKDYKIVFSTNKLNAEKANMSHPIKRTLQLLGSDLKKVKLSRINKYKSDTIIGNSDKNSNEFQSHCDVLVIGGGGIGSSIAYWLKKKARDGLNVVVVEKDPSYREASTVLSVGGLRQQFSLPENIQMSLFGADFVRDAQNELGDVDLNFTPHGYLLLASEEGSETLKRNSKLQNELGARNELLTATRLKLKFPWLNTDGVALGCHGLEKEGWFDPWALLMGLKKQSRKLGAHYVHGEVVNFEFREESNTYVEGETNCNKGLYKSLDKAVIRTSDGNNRTVNFAICIIAAGANSGQVARLAKIGTGQDLLSVPLPVEPRKRYVYIINSQGDNLPRLGSPLTIDPNGTYFRCDAMSGNYLCGRSPSFNKEPSVMSLDVDFEYFSTDVWPSIANRVKSFESAKVCNGWAGFYEFNLFDENGIIGPHPYYNNLYIATGFSGHGIQQAPAVGRAISELIIDGQFRTIDLTRLGFDRIIVNKPMFESNIV